jgi:hypothetical protein
MDMRSVRSRFGSSGEGRRRVVHRLSSVALAVVATVSWMSAGGVANASTVTVTDPAGDNGPFFDARGDVVNVTTAYETSAVVLTANTVVFDDPAMSANWSTGASGVVFNVDVDGDHVTDYFASFFSNGMSPYAVVVSAATQMLVCGAVPGWDSTANAYFVVIEPSCLGDPQEVATSASFQYTDEGWNTSYDNTDFTAVASPTTTTTTTASTTTTLATTTTIAATTTTTTMTEPAPTTTTTVGETSTTVATDCKPGNGWGDTNHVHCDRPLASGRRK